MSKAFVRESDDEPEAPLFARQGPALGGKNYLTADGERRLRAEFVRLGEVERPRLAALGKDPETRRELQIVNQRIRQLEATLRTAEVVDPPRGPADRVRFGATVTVRDPRGGESDYRLVGTEETDVDRGWVSWQSPIAKALLNAGVGERVGFQSPAGRTELEIVRVRYE